MKLDLVIRGVCLLPSGGNISRRYLSSTCYRIIEYTKWKSRRRICLAVIFIGTEAMRRLNLKYRGKNQTTDILSFAGTGEAGNEADIGTLFMNGQRIKRQAIAARHGFREETVFLLVHGILHLSGYEHEHTSLRKKDQMEKLQNKIASDLTS